LAIGDRFVEPITFSEVRFSLSADGGVQAPWAQAAKLSSALAQFPRQVATKPRMLAGPQTVESEIPAAMKTGARTSGASPVDPVARLREAPL